MLNTNKIYGEQREAQGSKAKALKERLLSYDKTNPSKFHLEEFDKQFIGKNNEMKNQAQRRNDLNEDVVKQMNKLVLYAKIATIRDRQKEEQKLMGKMYKNKEGKLDTMMELERLKELQLQEQREISRKKQQKEGALVIIDQIKEKDRERLKRREIQEKDGKTVYLLSRYEKAKIYTGKVYREAIVKV